MDVQPYPAATIAAGSAKKVGAVLKQLGARVSRASGSLLHPLDISNNNTIMLESCQPARSGYTSTGANRIRAAAALRPFTGVSGGHRQGPDGCRSHGSGQGVHYLVRHMMQPRALLH
eukprot:COSAG03_NODE_934_length_5267_cov_19.622485_8_plen_117_part_00